MSILHFTSVQTISSHSSTWVHFKSFRLPIQWLINWLFLRIPNYTLSFMCCYFARPYFLVRQHLQISLSILMKLFFLRKFSIADGAKLKSSESSSWCVDLILHSLMPLGRMQLLSMSTFQLRRLEASRHLRRGGCYTPRWRCPKSYVGFENYWFGEESTLHRRFMLTLFNIWYQLFGFSHIIA